MISENESNPFVNFGSGDLNFGFQLTYGIGMYLDELKDKNNKMSNFIKKDKTLLFLRRSI
jgi:hypothetical protein